MKILGIDPGHSRIGYGLLETEGDMTALDFGLIETEPGALNDKLAELAARMAKLLDALRPDIIAIEKLFFSKNQKTALAVAEARGVIKTIVLERGIKLLEYTPQEVKQAVTNDGRADKKSVAQMVCLLLKLKSIPGPDDVSDALAIAITGASRYKWDNLSMRNK